MSAINFPDLSDPPPRASEAVDEGRKFKIHWSGWFGRVHDALSPTANLLNKGFTGTITTAKLTGGGTTGSMTFQNGVLVSQTPAT